MLEDGNTGKLDETYTDYLHDESRQAGWADAIDIPRDEDGLRQALLVAAGAGDTVTIQGARTGITAGAVPRGGRILNCSRLTRIGPVERLSEGGATVTVEAGVTLEALRKVLPRDLWFTPDPTETSASVGGMAACNSSGARSFGYGPVRRHVQAARVALADGRVLDLRRGRERLDGRRLDLLTPGGRRIRGEAPSYAMPRVKNAAGYFVADDMDVLDAFIGSDGTLGVFTSLELKLLPAPRCLWGVMAFAPDVSAALEAVYGIRKLAREPDAAGARIAAIEFMDDHALDLLRREKADNPAFDYLPVLPPAWRGSVYVECHGDTETVVEDLILRVGACLDGCGVSQDATWLADGSRELERIQRFRHAVPEAVNLTIDRRRAVEPRLTKLGTDLAVPDAKLADVLAMYRDDLRAGGFEFVTFGHIGNNHVHVNILPRSMDAYEQGKALYLKWAGQVTAWGGSVSAEHGIGKLKTDLLEVMYGSEGIEAMRRFKRLFDPEWRLNPGNLFDQE